MSRRPIFHVSHASAFQLCVNVQSELVLSLDLFFAAVHLHVAATAASPDEIMSLLFWLPGGDQQIVANGMIDHCPSYSQTSSYDLMTYCENYELPELEKSLSHILLWPLLPLAMKRTCRFSSGSSEAIDESWRMERNDRSPSPSHTQTGSYDVINCCTNYELPELEKSLLLLDVFLVD